MLEGKHGLHFICFYLFIYFIMNIYCILQSTVLQKCGRRETQFFAVGSLRKKFRTHQESLQPKVSRVPSAAQGPWCNFCI